MGGDHHVGTGHGEAGHYEVLGVGPTATTAEIRVAYVALARIHHPDRLHLTDPADRDAAVERMAHINAAWTVLSDRGRRAAYDARLRGDSDETRWHVRDPGGGFEAFDADLADDDIDPRLLDDTPTGAAPITRSLAMFPAALGSVGVVVFGLGALLGFGGLFGLGVVLVVASGVSFLLIPLVALLASSRADRDP